MISPGKLVVGVGGPDLARHLLQSQPGVLGSLHLVVAEAEDPDAHVEDRVESEEHHDHHGHRHQHLREGEPVLFLPQGYPPATYPVVVYEFPCHSTSTSTRICAFPGESPGLERSASTNFVSTV